jgi:hypothetical protein
MRKAAKWATGTRALEKVKANAFFLRIDFDDEIQIVAKFAVCATAALIFSEIEANLAFRFFFLHCQWSSSAGVRGGCRCWQREASRFYVAIDVLQSGKTKAKRSGSKQE